MITENAGQWLSGILCFAGLAAGWLDGYMRAKDKWRVIGQMEGYNQARDRIRLGCDSLPGPAILQRVVEATPFTKVMPYREGFSMPYVPKPEGGQ